MCVSFLVNAHDSAERLLVVDDRLFRTTIPCEDGCVYVAHVYSDDFVVDLHDIGEIYSEMLFWLKLYARRGNWTKYNAMLDDLKYYYRCMRSDMRYNEIIDLG